MIFLILWKFFNFNILNFSGRFRNLNLFFIKQIFLIFFIFFSAPFSTFSLTHSDLVPRGWDSGYGTYTTSVFAGRHHYQQESSASNGIWKTATAGRHQSWSTTINHHQLSSIIINHDQSSSGGKKNLQLIRGRRNLVYLSWSKKLLPPV